MFHQLSITEIFTITINCCRELEEKASMVIVLRMRVLTVCPIIYCQKDDIKLYKIFILSTIYVLLLLFLVYAHI